MSSSAFATAPWAVIGNTIPGPTLAMMTCNVVTGTLMLGLAIWSGLASYAEPSRAAYRGPGRP